jgi:hypothetical protein
MNNFHSYITPKKAAELHNSIEGNDHVSVAHYRHLSKNKKMCFVCGMERVWCFGECGMCFSCTTGEADASDDFELIPS